MSGNRLNKFQQTNTKDEDLNKVQRDLVRTLNPIFNTEILGGSLLPSIALTSGSNSIDHKLGRNLTGWFITRLRSASTIYDTQDSNKTPDLTLELNSSAAVTIDLYVF